MIADAAAEAVIPAAAGAAAADALAAEKLRMRRYCSVTVESAAGRQEQKWDCQQRRRMATTK